MSILAMELIKQYPLIFTLTVVMPVIAGIVTAVIGWDTSSVARKARHTVKG